MSLVRPKIIKLGEKQSFGSAVLKAARVIKNGGIVVHPTDTCYGIAADITNAQAIKNVYLFKKRKDVLFNMIVKDFSQWKEYGKFYPVIDKIIKKYSNSQFSFIVPRTKKAPEFFRPGISTLSIQVPKLEFSLKFLEETGVPLIATSANISGASICYSVDKFFEQFPKESEFSFEVLVLDGGKLLGRKPSTIIEIIDSKKFNIIRAGDVSKIKI